MRFVFLGCEDITPTRTVVTLKGIKLLALNCRKKASRKYASYFEGFERMMISGGALQSAGAPTSPPPSLPPSLT